MKNTIEILAPAGSMESLTASIRCGANAVYLGGKDFSARKNATNFDNDELKQACITAHKSGVKIYQTLNTIFFDEQLSGVKKAIEYASEIGIDALIIQDLGAAYLARQIAPAMPLHASTQMTIHTKSGALFAKECGFSRIVAAREMSRRQLSEIADLGIETEVFVHGALCMSVSGQCYMSGMIGSRSANRGLCAQACRLPFSAVKGEIRCDLSLKDLCNIPHINDMHEMGITSLKIEGRMKRPEYVAAAVTACRQALNGEAPDLDTLKAVFSRSGFTDGYFTGNHGFEMFGTRQKEDVVSAASVLPNLAELYRKEHKAATVNLNFTLEKDAPARLEIADCDGNLAIVFGDIPQTALNRPTDFAQAEKQLSKLGGTIYDFGGLDAEIADGLILPASALNDLRRKAVDALDEIRIVRYTTIKKVHSAEINPTKKKANAAPKLRAEIKSSEQLKTMNLSQLEYIILPLAETKKLANFEFKNKIILSLPRWCDNEQEVISALSSAISDGFDKIQCNNVGHIKIGQQLKLKMFGGFGLNVTNSYSLEFLAECGLVDCTASFECTLKQLSTLSSRLPFGAITYGKLPMMLTVNCPIKQAVGCKNCTHTLTDRTNRTFSVECGGDAIEILNCDTLYMADRLREIVGAEFFTLKFENESSDKINEVISAHLNAEKPKGEFTRGLYYRGVL